MAKIVFALGSAFMHTALIKLELTPFLGDVKVVKFNHFDKFNEASVRRALQRYGEDVAAYVLPEDDGSFMNDDDDQPARHYWKMRAEQLCPSDSIKELAVAQYDCRNGMYWLDGVDQYQLSRYIHAS